MLTSNAYTIQEKNIGLPRQHLGREPWFDMVPQSLIKGSGNNYTTSPYAEEMKWRSFSLCTNNFAERRKSKNQLISTGLLFIHDKSSERENNTLLQYQKIIRTLRNKYELNKEVQTEAVDVELDISSSTAPEVYIGTVTIFPLPSALFSAIWVDICRSIET